MSRVSVQVRVARQHVDLARLQRGEALLRGERHELDLVGVAEDRRGDGAAEVDVEARPLALAVGAAKPATPVLTPQIELPRCLDVVEILASHGAGRHEDRGQTSRRCQ